MKFLWIYIFHIIFVSPFLLFLGYEMQKDKPISDKVKKMTVVIGIITFIYHFYLLVVRSKAIYWDI